MLALLMLAAIPAFAHDDDPPSAMGPVQILAAGSGANAPTVAPDGKWSVDNPPGEHHDVPLDTRTGTWMSVDVSPDGTQLVFDLLGDLYTLSIAGGEARAISSGMAWDEQPRFSPDGKRIAFTSDRSGGDNIWIVDRDGAHPRQVTKETFRLLNSPAWTPDGQYIAARKHFTSTRSAGAGEIWLYHWTGGEGAQMTKRRTEQKDEGEPAFSRDGRWLYWSMDATPGQSFEYNKDANTQIYCIQRLDRESGEVRTFQGGAGGAIRPTPSPDGKTVAFIRRVRGKSVLYLGDVTSGAEKPLYDGLDRDNQEVWAVHGVYPGIAWTPDSRELVFWSKGGLHRIDVATRAVRDIPFHVTGTRRVTEAVRFATPVAPDSLRTHMLRWVSVSPQGDRVAYAALGHLYVRALPDGRPVRLTRADDVFESHPAWSRDGKWIVYSTWNDDALGQVRVVASTGGTGRTVTSKPGHYVEPVFSPDGATIVYRAIGGGYLFSPLWSEERGLYAVATAGGASRRIVDHGQSAHFAARNDRVYYVEVGGADQDERNLVSIALDGTDERTHLKGVYYTEIKMSPDEKWVAFREKYKLWVAPFTFTGRPADLGPSARNFPVKLVSRDAGDWIDWSGNSRSVSWALGEALYTRELTELFTFAPGAPDSLVERPARRIDVGFAFAHDKPAGSIALTGARILTMKGDEVIEDGTVVVTGNRITAIGPRASTAIPAGAQVFDARGKTITPGLVDAHWHGGMGTEQLVPQRSWIDYASLAFGVTTLHDPSNDSGEIFTQAELQRAGLIVAPRIFSTGTILYGAKGDFRADVDSVGDALMHLGRMKAYGASSVKSYNQPRRDQRQQVLEAARRLRMNVVPEGGALFPHNMTMVIDGHTGLEHALPIARVYDDVVQLWSATKVGYTPTFNVAYGGLDGEHYWYAKTPVWANERLQAFVPRRILDARARRPVTAPDNEWNHIVVAEEAAKLHRAGVGVQIGAHGQREGLGSHWEIWSMVLGGMTPHEALQCATIGGAKYLGYDREVGSLEVGKLADLIVMDRDPLADIRNSESISRVMMNGRLYDAARMDEIAPRQKPRGAFWWEAEQAELRTVAH
ncbi:MAG: PD40 domain-containing protein [Candidatus Eisenbacteria bacterium]|nr:PD40 domain-containing protein [Candidatus Eisenbacteria bacterium]